MNVITIECGVRWIYPKRSPIRGGTGEGLPLGGSGLLPGLVVAFFVAGSGGLVLMALYLPAFNSLVAIPGVEGGTCRALANSELGDAKGSGTPPRSHGPLPYAPSFLLRQGGRGTHHAFVVLSLPRMSGLRFLAALGRGPPLSSRLQPLGHMGAALAGVEVGAALT